MTDNSYTGTSISLNNKEFTVSRQVDLAIEDKVDRHAFQQTARWIELPKVVGHSLPGTFFVIINRKQVKIYKGNGRGKGIHPEVDFCIDPIFFDIIPSTLSISALRWLFLLIADE